MRRRCNKIGVFSFENVEVWYFVEWIFFCKFVSYVWCVVCGG